MHHNWCKAWGLQTDLGQEIHFFDRRSDSKPRSGAFFHAHHRRVTTYPTLLASKFCRKNHDYLDLRAFRHPGLSVKEYAIRAEVTGMSSLLRVPRRGSHLHGNLGDNPLAQAAFCCGIHEG